MNSQSPEVGIIMGSRSDWETMQHAAAMLEELGIAHECRVVSAHRTPDRLVGYAKGAAARGLRIIIAGAGGAAHLPGMAAAMTSLPVLGVPVESKALSGLDSLLSIVQMPGGIPVGTLAIGKAGAINAALLAAAILSLSDKGLAAPPRQVARRADRCRGHRPGMMREHTAPLPPGATIGIIGGGQLGRMLVMAAARLGYRVHIFAPDTDSCAAEISAKVTQAAYSDRAALAAFAEAIDVATFEFENIDAKPLTEVESRVSLWPPLQALEIGQDRIREKRFAADLGARTAPWAPVSSRIELDDAIAAIGLPAILKTTRFGYDGKGQVRIKSHADVESAWALLGGRPAILEGVVAFDHEFSLLVARDQGGGIAFWDCPENVHRDGILDTSRVPAAEPIRQQVPAARGLARRLAEKLDYVGVFAIEFFAGRDGPVFNEMAPRVHNSGHWTIEGAVTSQFENHIRAVAGLPLGSTRLTGSSVTMRNIIGPEANDWLSLASDSGSHLHLYGKDEARPGRKMGHITRVIAPGDRSRS